MKKSIKQITILNGIKAILGGACIALGTYFSKMCPYPILSPLLFSVGIFLVMAFDLFLITRFVPTNNKPLSPLTFYIWTLNLLSAGVLGFFAPQLSAPSMPFIQMFLMSVLGGIVIGLVSLNNTKDSPYKAIIALLLMYGFVMLGLPHCVSYTFLHADLGTLLVVSAGNILGGLLLNVVRNRTDIVMGVKTLKETLFGKDE